MSYFLCLIFYLHLHLQSGDMDNGCERHVNMFETDRGKVCNAAVVSPKYDRNQSKTKKGRESFCNTNLVKIKALNEESSDDTDSEESADDEMDTDQMEEGYIEGNLKIKIKNFNLKKYKHSFHNKYMPHKKRICLDSEKVGEKEENNASNHEMNNETEEGEKERRIGDEKEGNNEEGK